MKKIKGETLFRSTPKPKFAAAVIAAGVLALGVAACGSSDDSSSSSSSSSDGNLSGTIRIDGSSTVGPLTSAVAEGFMADNPDVKISVGTSGTGGGFEKFCAGETQANDASREIESDEASACKKEGIGYAGLTVASDALTVVTNPENPVKCMTVEQLKQVWEPKSTVSSWSDITGLDPAYDEELQLFGPGTDSGTFDYFTEAINGEEGASRTDYNNVGEDDNQTVTGVAGSPGGMGYFGYSFFKENEGTVNGLEIDNGKGCVAPSTETVQDGTYAPLGRPLFIYPSDKALKDAAMDAFLEYYLENVNDVAEQVGFIPLTTEQLNKSKSQLQKLINQAG